MSDASAAWAVVAAALGSATLTSGVSVWIEARRSRRDKSQQRLSDLKTACIDLISSAQRLAHRTGFLHLTMYARSGLPDALDVVLHHRKPIDVIELGEQLDRDFGPMLRAQAALWILGDEKLIAAASRIVLTSAEVISKSTALPDSASPPDHPTRYQSVAYRVRSLKTLKMDEETEMARNEALRELGKACWAFGQIVRSRLGLNVDELVRALPGFANPRSETNPTS